MFTVSSTLIWAVLTGQTDWVCHIETLMLCMEAVACSCIIVTWWSGSGEIQAWSRRPTGFFQWFDTIGLVIWPVKIVPEMTYNVLSGTLSLYTITTTLHLINSSKSMLTLKQSQWNVSSMVTVIPAINSCSQWNAQALTSNSKFDSNCHSVHYT